MTSNSRLQRDLFFSKSRVFVLGLYNNFFIHSPLDLSLREELRVESSNKLESAAEKEEVNLCVTRDHNGAGRNQLELYEERAVADLPSPSQVECEV